ncbi:hypothetical protein D3C74_299210 [compost metagenome]
MQVCILEISRGDRGCFGGFNVFSWPEYCVTRDRSFSAFLLPQLDLAFGKVGGVLPIAYDVKTVDEARSLDFCIAVGRVAAFDELKPVGAV